MNYLKLIKTNFSFLVDFGYKVDDEQDSLLWKYVRYLNEEKRRLISIGFDLRENEVSINIWQLTPSGEEIDSNSRSLDELLLSSRINEQVTMLPKDAITKTISEDVIDNILNERASIVKKYFMEIVNGSKWE